MIDEFEQRLTSRPGGGGTTSWARSLPALAALAWLLPVMGLVVLAARAQWTNLLALVRDYPQRLPSLDFALIAVGSALLLAICARLISPRWWRWAVLVLALLPVPTLLITSGNIAAGCAAMGLLCPACWLGREFAGQLLEPIDSPDAWLVGGAFGVGALAALGYVLGSIGALRPHVIWTVLLAVTLAQLGQARVRRRLRADLAACRDWIGRPDARRWGDVGLAGLLLGYFWLDLIGALAPEILADAVRTRLPAAALFARAGQLVVAPEVFVYRVPHVGEVIYGVALASGPVQTAKLLNLAVGLLCAAAVWGLGRRLGGHHAALVAILCFYTLSMTTIVSQTALVDLFSTLFAVTAMLLLVLRDRPDRRTVAAAVVCIGAGMWVKTSFGLIAAGLAVALVVAAAPRSRGWAIGVPAVLAGGALLLVALQAAWPLVRETTVPGVSQGQDLVARLWGVSAGALADYNEFGGERSWHALLRSPVEITLHTSRFGQHQDGFAGYLLQALVPLVILTRLRRRVGIVLIGAVVAYLAWFALTQYLRYALPIGALLCAVGGAAYVAVWERSGGVTRTLMGLCLPVLVGAGLLGYLGTALVYPGHIPYRVVFGQQSKEDYLTDNLEAYKVLRLLDAEPNAKRALSAFEYGRLYTRVPIDRAFNQRYIGWQIPSNERELLQRLDEGGYTHIIISRRDPPPELEFLPVLDEEFLRRNAALVGGDRNAYLYRLVPPDQRGHDQGWAQGSDLLPNGGFEVTRADQPITWSRNGGGQYDGSGTASHDGRGAVRVTGDESFSTTVEVVPNARYLLSHMTRGTDGHGAARLQINWLDRDDHLASVSLETVPVSPQAYHRYSMLATAPGNATSAVVYVQVQYGTVWFDDVSLRPVDPDPQEDGPNLIADPSFEGLLAGRSAAWQPHGDQSEAGTGVQLSSLTDGAAVFAHPDNGYAQLVQIAPGKAYRLGYTAWGSSGAKARLQINWLDANRQFINVTMHFVEVTERPTTYAAWMLAPPRAMYAQVFVSVQAGGPIWFDDYALRVGRLSTARRGHSTPALSVIAQSTVVGPPSEQGHLAAEHR